MPKPSAYNANESYLAHREIIDAKIVQLQERLREHAEKQATQAWNWGYVGDLLSLNGKLDEMLQGFEDAKGKRR